MIRLATKYDTSSIIKIMKQFRAESPVHELLAVDDEEHWRELLNQIFAGKGKIFYEEDKGLLISMIMPSIWSKQILVLHELAWYVLPEHRHTSIGYRLVKAYINYGEQLVSSERIRYYTLNKMVSSPNLKYEKLGFTKIDEIWVR